MSCESINITYDILVDSEVTGDPSIKLDLAQFNTKYLKINVVPTNIIGEL